MALGWILNKVRSGWNGGAEATDPALAVEQPSSLPWEDAPGVSPIRASLRALGFQEIGAFRMARQPEIQFLAAHYPQAHFYALIHPPSEEGTAAIELCCQIDELSGISVTNSATLETWHDSPGNTTVRLPAIPVGTLFSTLLQRTAGQDRIPTSPETFVPDFQRALARRLDWQARKEQAMKAIAERKSAP